MKHHRLDPYPIPKEKTPLCINEPWLIDKSLLEYPPRREPDEKEDNVRIYIPMDLNRDAILRRLDRVIAHYGEATEENEMEFGVDVGMIISQVEIYDQVWVARNLKDAVRVNDNIHSPKGIQLAKEIISVLMEDEDCAESFPYNIIDELRAEFGI